MIPGTIQQLERCQCPQLRTPSHHPHRAAPLRTPLHCPGHASSHIAHTTPAISATAIAVAVSTSEVPCADTFSLWDGNNAPPEVLKA